MCAKWFSLGVHHTEQAWRSSHRHIRISGIRCFGISAVTRICWCGSCRPNRANRQPSQPCSRNYRRDFALSELLSKESGREFCWLRPFTLYLDPKPFLGQVRSISQILHEHYGTDSGVLPKTVAKRSDEGTVGSSSPRFGLDSCNMEGPVDEPRKCALWPRR